MGRPGPRVGLRGSIAVRSVCGTLRTPFGAGDVPVADSGPGCERCGTMDVGPLVWECRSKAYSNVEHRTSNFQHRIIRKFNVGRWTLDVRCSVSCLFASLAFVAVLAAADFARADYAETMALFRAGKYAECIDEAQEGIAEEASSENLRSLKIRAELALGRYAEALESLDDGLQRLPGSLELRWLGREVCRYNDDTERARQLDAQMAELVEKFQPRRRFPVSAQSGGRSQARPDRAHQSGEKAVPRFRPGIHGQRRSRAR
jgi:tetratricopeptide (TPR) repeat protein